MSNNLFVDDFICKIINRLPNLAESGENGFIEYLGLLDEILADRNITYDESESLFELASQYNISKPQAISLHKRYLANGTHHQPKRSRLGMLSPTQYTIFSNPVLKEMEAIIVILALA